jgi:hypothetical protein
MPGEILPPKNRPLASIISSVMAVPVSITKISWPG